MAYQDDTDPTWKGSKTYRSGKRGVVTVSSPGIIEDASQDQQAQTPDITSALFPRAQAALNSQSPYLQQAIGAGLDIASLPGRAYASLGRPTQEDYTSALARLAGLPSQSTADQFSESVLRDPSNALVPLGVGIASKVPAIAEGIRTLGFGGRVATDAAANTAAQMANEYSQTGSTGNPLAAGLTNAAMDVGVRGLGKGLMGAASRIAPEEAAANFQKWFGGSKVVDEAGNPLVVYHGSPDVRGIYNEGFKPSPTRGEAYFATTNQQMANSYADPTRAWDYQNAEHGVVPMYMNLENPKVIDAGGQPWRNTEAVIEQARNEGADGVIIKNSKDFYSNTPKTGGGDVYVAFNPTQMKSALDKPLLSRVDRTQIPNALPNRGTWDPTDPNITHLTAGTFSEPYLPGFTDMLAGRLNTASRQAVMDKYGRKQ